MKAFFTHVALHVRDLDRCVDFYTRYCGLSIVHDRTQDGKRIVWMAEPGREGDLVFVLLPGGPGSGQALNDYSHLGFALESRAAVDQLAERARQEGLLVWPPVDEPYPTGYYCGVREPNGGVVEFSFGQPLGPGAKEPRAP